jgi:hypothetical protein
MKTIQRELMMSNRRLRIEYRRTLSKDRSSLNDLHARQIARAIRLIDSAMLSVQQAEDVLSLQREGRSKSKSRKLRA